jgi:hypothetical protein
MGREREGEGGGEVGGEGEDLDVWSGTTWTMMQRQMKFCMVQTHLFVFVIFIDTCGYLSHSGSGSSSSSSIVLSLKLLAPPPLSLSNHRLLIVLKVKLIEEKNSAT